MLNVYIRKEKKEQIKHKVSRRKGIIKIKADINDRINRENQQNKKLFLRLSDVENRPMGVGRGEGGMDSEFGISRCKLL